MLHQPDMKRLNQTGQWSTVIAFLAIAWLAVLPSEIAAIDDFNDKLKHLFAFGVLTIGLLRYWRMAAVPAVICLLCFGVGIEVVQSFIPGRTASAWDVLADLAGILAGLALVALSPVRPASADSF